MDARDILDALTTLQFENTFNPYTERCETCDIDHAPEIRRDYLEQMLEQAAATELDAIWVGRDLGHRGGRRTGLALTDDINFKHHLYRWDLEPKRITNGQPVAERTAANIWSILLKVNAPVFLWNVFPLHPFEAGRPFSNRSHNAEERRAGLDILLQIIDLLQPRRIIAIGNDAYSALSSRTEDRELYKVRHPSYGGQKDFLKSMRFLYRDSLTNTDLFRA